MDVWFHTYGCNYAPPGWMIRSLPYTNRLYYVLDGSGFFLAPQGEIPLMKGRLYLFPHRLPFRVRQDENDRLNHMFFDFMLSPPLTGEAFTELTVPPGSAMDHLVRSLMLALKESPQDDALIRHCFLALLHLVLRENHELPTDARLTAALSRIHDGFSEEISDGELAALSHMEKNHFIRVFRRETGITPYQYLKEYRLNRATTLIAEGMPVGEAARLCGFESGSSLSHAMKKCRGMSPTMLAGHLRTH